MTLPSRTTIYPSRRSWLVDARRGPPDFMIGASTAGKILGVAPASQGGAWATWLDARDWAPEMSIQRDEEQTEDMRRGTWWESRLVDWYLDHEAERVVADVALARVSHPEHPWLRASPDVVLRSSRIEGGGATGLVEIKTQRYRAGWGKDGTTIERAEEWALEQVPPHILVQVYIQLACAGLPWCDIVVGFGFADIRVIRVLADPEYQGRLVQLLAEWRERHLIGDEEPAVDDSSACAQHLGSRDREGEREGTADERGQAEVYAMNRALEKSAASSKRRASSALLHLMGDTKRLHFPQPDGPPARVTARANGGLNLRGFDT